MKYVFNLLAIAFASFMRSLLKTNSSGNFLDVEFDPSFTFLRNSWLKPDDCLWVDPPWFN